MDEKELTKWIDGQFNEYIRIIEDMYKEGKINIEEKYTILQGMAYRFEERANEMYGI